MPIELKPLSVENNASKIFIADKLGVALLNCNLDASAYRKIVIDLSI